MPIIFAAVTTLIAFGMFYKAYEAWEDDRFSLMWGLIISGVVVGSLGLLAIPMVHSAAVGLLKIP